MFLPSLSRVTFIANYLFRLYMLGDKARQAGLIKPNRIDCKDDHSIGSEPWNRVQALILSCGGRYLTLSTGSLYLMSIDVFAITMPMTTARLIVMKMPRNAEPIISCQVKSAWRGVRVLMMPKRLAR